MWTNSFFGCEIANLDKKQYDELKQAHELPIARKMGLGENLPRKLLCTKKTALGVGLIQSKTVIDSLEI